MFTRILLHALIDMPHTQGGSTITKYLPKSVSPAPKSASSLLYPLAMDHIIQPAGMKLSFLSIPAFCIFYVTKGSGQITSNEKVYETVPGTLLLIDCSSPFSFAAEKNFEYDIIYYAGNQSSFFFEMLTENDPATTVLKIDSFGSSGLNPFLRPILPTGDRSQSHNALAFNRYLTDFFTEAFDYLSSGKTETENAIPDYLRQVKEYIDNNFYKNISLSELESTFFVSRYRICREFTDLYYVSPIQYLHQVRIKKAKLLLNETPLKIHEIGYQVGYESTNLFINHFKKITGKTPSQMRN